MACTNLSEIDWKSSGDRSSGCGTSTVGRGLPGSSLVGSGGGGGGGGVFSITGSGGGGVGGDGVFVRSRVVVLRRLASCSARAAALGGSFLFLSIATTKSSGRPMTRRETGKSCYSQLRRASWVARRGPAAAVTGKSQRSKSFALVPVKEARARVRETKERRQGESHQCSIQCR